MTTAPHRDTTPALAAPDKTGTAPLPRIKLSPQGFAIDHPNQEAGERLMADALGVTSSEAMRGILTQLVKASVKGERPDATTLAFMLAMVKSIAPRDAIEAMLAAQMVSVHVMAMRCAFHLASAGEMSQQDGAARALGRLTRTFPAQMEALTRYRNKDETAVSVQNLSVEGRGKAIMGNLTQHARVIVADPGAAAAAAETQTVPPIAARDRQPCAVKTTPAGRA